MTKKQRVRYDMFIRVVQYLQDNAADFTKGVVAAQLLILIGIIDRLQVLVGDQSAGLGNARFEFNDKDTARENLRAMLELINQTARSMVYAFPGINLKFQMPQGDSDVNLLAKARAFLIEATPYEDAFVEDYLMDANFLTVLQTLIDDFEASLGAPGTAIDSHVEATAEIGAEIRKGMIAVRTMDGPVRNKYHGSIGKLNAWNSASHIEKVPVERPRTDKDAEDKP